MAQPGMRVLVHAGVYREWVRPARGGSGPDATCGHNVYGGAAQRRWRIERPEAAVGLDE
jgi:hypothetical protein